MMQPRKVRKIRKVNLRNKLTCYEVHTRNSPTTAIIQEYAKQKHVRNNL